MRGKMPERPQVGVGVIIERDGRVLLMRRQGAHGDGNWSNPGGHLEYGESIEECAVREVREEVGITVQHIAFYAMTNDIFAGIGRHYITLWVTGQYVSGEAVANSTREMSEIGWFAWDALPEPLFLPLANLVAGQKYPRNAS